MFHPVTAAYREAGIEIVAIGIDSVRGTAQSFNNLAPADRFGFPMLSDRKLRSFRSWLAFDDFEHMTMHGTFLLDAEGRLLWQDIDDQPFEHPAWLLHECRRLLAIPRPKDQ